MVIAGDAVGTLVNTATITAPGGVTDPVPGNNSATDTTSLDAPPVITNFTVTPGTINENGTVDLSVTFTDPNTPEPHEVVIDWGDGITETINLPIGVLTASADHQYLDDNPTATPSDDYTVTVTVNEPLAVWSRISVAVQETRRPWFLRVPGARCRIPLHVSWGTRPRLSNEKRGICAESWRFFVLNLYYQDPPWAQSKNA